MLMQNMVRRFAVSCWDVEDNSVSPLAPLKEVVKTCPALSTQVMEHSYVGVAAQVMDISTIFHFTMCVLWCHAQDVQTEVPRRQYLHGAIEL